MKKFKFSKKVGLFALSAITAATIGLAAVSANNVTANAAYDYTTTPKSDEYIANLVKSNSNKITVTPGYTLPAEDKTSTYAQRSGVLLTYENGVSSDVDYVEINRAYKVNELEKAVNMIPLINSATQAGTTSSFNKIDIEIVEKDGDAVKRSVVIRMASNSSWVGQNQSASAAMAFKPDAPVVNQTFAGYNLSTHNRLDGSPYVGKKYLRQMDNAFYTNAGFTGGRGGLEARDITYGYVQKEANGKKYVQAITDRPANGGLNSEVVSGFSVIRDFNIDWNAAFVDQPGADNDFANALGSEAVFDGFTDDADLYLRIKASSNIEGARLLITNVAGEDMASPVKVDRAAYKAVVGKSYKLPKVKSYFNSKAGEDFNGTYSITVPEQSALVVNDEEYTGTDTVTPDVSGRYKVTYKTDDGDGNKYEGVYYFEAIESATIKFTKTPAAANATNTVRGAKFDLGAAATSTIYSEGEDNTVVAVSVFYYGDSYDNSSNLEFATTQGESIGESYEYEFKNAGKYRILYRAYDEADNKLYYGDKQVAIDPASPETKINCVELEIKNLYFALTVEDYNDWALGVQTKSVKVNRDIVKFYDFDYGRNFWDNSAANAVCAMTVKEPGATAARNFTEGELTDGYNFGNLFGEYVFGYTLTYARGTETCEFKINLIDDQAPEIYLIDSEYVYGAVSGESADGKNYTYNVTAGSTVTFGALRAEDKVGVKNDYTDDIKLTKILKGVATDLTDSYNVNRNAYAVTLTEDDDGVIYKFSVEEVGGTGSDTLTFTFKVQKSFITVGFDKTFGSTYGTDDTVKFDGFKVYNEKSEEVAATKQIEIKRVGDEQSTVISGGTGDYKFVLSGEYEVVFKAEYEGAAAEKTYVLKVTDKTAPEITVKGEIVKKGVKGSGIAVPEFSGSDLETSANTTVKVVNAAGEEINVYEGKFVPTEAGVYTVTITSVDDNGNANTYTYSVEIADAAIKSFPLFRTLGFIIGGVLIAAAAALFVLAFAGKKTKVSAETEENESDDLD